MSPALAGGSLTTAPPGKPPPVILDYIFIMRNRFHRGKQKIMGKRLSQWHLAQSVDLLSDGFMLLRPRVLSHSLSASFPRGEVENELS